MANLDFLREGIKNMKTIGSVSRTSKFVSKMMVNQIDFVHSQVIVELGAGDGAITHHILEKMSPNARLLVFEVNPAFCLILRNIKDDRMEIIEDSALFIEKHLTLRNIKNIDIIISAIPFVILPKDEVQGILKEVRKTMTSTSIFVQLHYSLVLKKIYEKIFTKIKIEFVALNIPPAFIFICQR